MNVHVTQLDALGAGPVDPAVKLRPVHSQQLVVAVAVAKRRGRPAGDMQAPGRLFVS